MKKVWNTVRITKMWHRDTKWANDPGENGASRVATKFQFLKVATFVKHKKVQSSKTRYPYMDNWEPSFFF